MNDTDLRISAYGQKCRHYDDPNLGGVHCQVFADKFTRGDDSCDDVPTIRQMLLMRWASDAHLTCYVSLPAARVRKDRVDDYHLWFNCVCLDLDFKDHDECPRDEDFADILMLASLMDHPPNVVYATAKGCRWVYLIVPTTDAEWFESHAAALAKTIAEPVANANMGYLVDTAAKDWTRLFRCPRVIRDGKEQYDGHIRVLHDDLIDLDGFRVKRQAPRPIATGDKAFDSCDLYMLRLIKVDMHTARNNAAFSACCHALRTYTPEAAEQWIEKIRAEVISLGLPEKEFEDALRSARKQRTNKKDK